MINQGALQLPTHFLIYAQTLGPQDRAEKMDRLIPTDPLGKAHIRMMNIPKAPLLTDSQKKSPPRFGQMVKEWKDGERYRKTGDV